jgi:ubiquinone/menaquinone biosynthesis C-methylase UbiE
MMDKKNRWRIAQSSEKKYWDIYKSPEEELRNLYKNKADVLVREFEQIMPITDKTKILNVGSGPLGFLYYFKKGKLFSLDPLADFFKKKYKIRYRDNFKLIKGVGEELPFPDESFDIVGSLNTLDHTHLPKKVLSEANRVLKKSGLLYIETNIVNIRFLILAKIWSIIYRIIYRNIFNKPHPYILTKRYVKKILPKNLKIIKEEELEKQGRKKNKKIMFLAKLGFNARLSYAVYCKKI